MDVQYLIVYLLIAAALVAVVCFVYRRWQAFRKSKAASVCQGCALKDSCTSGSKTNGCQ